jgi:glycosyltransferase involved in cell wall biosynthesis
VEFEELKRLMAEADFHVTLLNNEDTQARTELRTCLLEAMAAGMACLHVPTPAVSGDVFRDGENIVLVDPDDPARSAEKFLAIADKPGKLEAIGRNAVQTVETHFDFETQYQKFLARLKAKSKSGIGR